jgi:hypothetical protein
MPSLLQIYPQTRLSGCSNIKINRRLSQNPIALQTVEQVPRNYPLEHVFTTTIQSSTFSKAMKDEVLALMSRFERPIATSIIITSQARIPKVLRTILKDIF